MRNIKIDTTAPKRNKGRNIMKGESLMITKATAIGNKKEYGIDQHSR
jgi:hypothetical protein